MTAFAVETAQVLWELRKGIATCVAPADVCVSLSVPRLGSVPAFYPRGVLHRGDSHGKLDKLETWKDDGLVMDEMLLMDLGL